MKAINAVDRQKSHKSQADCTRRLLMAGALVAFFTLISDQAWAMTTNPAKVVTYPAPAGEPLSTDYDVQVLGQNVDVYTARVLDAPFAGKEWDYGGNYAFANFDMSSRVAVRIVSKQSLRQVVIRPQSLGIKPILVDDHTLTLTLERPCKLSIEPEGKKAPLLLFGNPLEVKPPKPDDEGVVYFAPGVHKPEKIVLQSNQTLYLAGGAVSRPRYWQEGTTFACVDVVFWMALTGRGVQDPSET